jgi:hypothetical protein
MENNFNYDLIIKKLNNICENFENNIFLYYKKKNIIIRNTKVSYLNTFIYTFLYIQKNNTKLDAVNQLNTYYKFENKKDLFKRTTLFEKEKNIPTYLYSEIYKNLLNLYNEFFIDKDIKRLIAVDGTYNNTNVYNIKGYLETSLNLRFFDINNDIPLDLTFNGIKNKNNELNVLLEYIKNNNEKFKNVILILDRAYCSYSFINYLNKNKINFVCRFRNNCKKFDKKIKDLRVINFCVKHYETINNDNIDNILIDNKKFKSIDVEINDEYKLVSNLSKETYDNKFIKDLYNKRWDIEVFFKNLKNNFNFENLRYTNNNDDFKNYEIHNVKILICCLISKILEKSYLKVNNIQKKTTVKKRNIKKNKVKTTFENIKNKRKKKNEIKKEIINVNLKDITHIKKDNQNNESKNEDIIIKENKTPEYIQKINKTQLFNCVFLLIIPIFNGDLTTKDLIITFNKWISLQKSSLNNNNNNRVCKTPFLKWYIKGYTNKSDKVKILHKLLNIETKLNKNLKFSVKRYLILKINFISS